MEEASIDCKRKSEKIVDLKDYAEQFKNLLSLNPQEEEFDRPAVESRLIELTAECPILVQSRRFFSDLPPLHCACLQGASLNIIQQFYEADEKAIDFHHHGRTYAESQHVAFLLALQGKCEVDVLQFLLDKHQASNSKTPALAEIDYIRSLAFYEYSNLEVAKFLLKICPPDAIQARLPNGDTIVHRAIIRRCFRRGDYNEWLVKSSEVVKFLVSAWPEVLNVRNDGILTPLHSLLWHDDNDTDLVEFMVRKNPNALSYFKLRYPLIWIFQDHSRLIELTAKLYPRQYVNLQDACLKAEEASSFARGLNQNPLVREVALERASMERDGLESFLTALETPKLDSLFIACGNDVDGGSMLYPSLLSTFFRKSPNVISFSTSQPIATSTSLGLEANTTLEELYISVTSRNDLSTFADALIANENAALKRLHITFVGSCNAQLQSLTRLLQHSSCSLRALHLSGVTECMALKRLGDVMRDINTSLVELELEPSTRQPFAATMEYHRKVLAYYARLNKTGRGRGRMSKKTMVMSLQDVIGMQEADCNMLSKDTPQVQVLYGLLRDMPHIWST